LSEAYCFITGTPDPGADGEDQRAHSSARTLSRPSQHAERFCARGPRLPSLRNSCRF